MLKDMSTRCIDINSFYCPCLLAETNNCVFCSQLSGGTVCDCNWSGICILYDKYWKDKQNNWNHKGEMPIRIEWETNFAIKEQISENTYWLEFNVSDELAQQIKRTGSFVFLRHPADQQFYHFPVGVMQVDGNTIHVVIETVGPKSVRLIEGNNRQILVRGPYYNGVLGQPWIDNITEGRILLVAGGIGQAPALPLVEKLVHNKNEIIALLAPGHVRKIFISDQLTDWGVQVHSVASMRQVGMPLLKELFKLKPDLVVSAGPDDQHYAIISAMHEVSVNIPMAATNNATMCCGEGVCGSCHKQTQDNKMVRMCKVQTDFAQLVHD